MLLYYHHHPPPPPACILQWQWPENQTGEDTIARRATSSALQLRLQGAGHVNFSGM